MYKFLGVTDDKTTCECCGKTNLKRTVALESDTNGIVYYGTTCAVKALRSRGHDVTVATVNVELDAINYAQKLFVAPANYTPEQIAKAVNNRTGFPTWIKDNVFYIGKFYSKVL